MQVLVIVRIVFLFVQVALPHLHVVVVHDHALEVELGHVHELVECVLAIRREYEARAIHAEQLPDGCAQVLAELVEKEAVGANNVVEAVLQVAVVGVFGPLEEAALDTAAELVVTANYLEILEARLVAIGQKYFAWLAASADL